MRTKRFIVAVVVLALAFVAFQSYAGGVTPGPVSQIGASSGSIPHCMVESFSVSTDIGGDIDLVTPSVSCTEAGNYFVSATVTADGFGGGVATAALSAVASDVPVIVAPAISFTDGYEVVFQVRKHTE